MKSQALSDLEMIELLSELATEPPPLSSVPGCKWTQPTPDPDYLEPDWRTS